jgi:hypothetical protein
MCGPDPGSRQLSRQVVPGVRSGRQGKLKNAKRILLCPLRPPSRCRLCWCPEHPFERCSGTRGRSCNLGSFKLSAWYNRERCSHLEARVKAPASALCARREMDYASQAERPPVGGEVASQIDAAAANVIGTLMEA